MLCFCITNSRHSKDVNCLSITYSSAIKSRGYQWRNNIDSFQATSLGRIDVDFIGTGKNWLSSSFSEQSLLLGTERSAWLWTTATSFPFSYASLSSNLFFRF